MSTYLPVFPIPVKLQESNSLLLPGGSGEPPPLLQRVPLSPVGRVVALLLDDGLRHVLVVLLTDVGRHLQGK